MSRQDHIVQSHDTLKIAGEEHAAVLFDDALETAVKKIKAVKNIFTKELVLVRDLRGCIRLLLPGSLQEYGAAQKQELERLKSVLKEALGVYGFPPDQAALFKNDLFLDYDNSIKEDQRLIDKAGEMEIYLLDRQIIGQDWMRSPFKRKTQTRRVTFFGIKGGVGRSTALVIWAWRLAKQGKRVLIFDLDLESPGVSSTLLPEERSPDYGIVDWFVEDGVGQSHIIEGDMVAVSPLASDLSGEIRVVPAFGRKPGDYLSKLARCYAESTGNDAGRTENRLFSWGERVERMVERIEKMVDPDVVILDSRAGLHDIAAVLVTRMEADVFLFAVDSAQTWTAYSFLFQHWNGHPEVSTFRQRLQMVAGMVPETGREEYFKRFREHSWTLFSDNLYDQAESDTVDAFNFDLADNDAPHAPVPVYWHRALQEFGPVQSEMGLDAKVTEEAMGDFISEADKMIFSESLK